MKNEPRRSLIIIVILFIFFGCSSRRAVVRGLKVNSNNLRVTLLKAQRDHISGTIWGIENQQFTNWVDSVYYNAAQAVFSSIGSVSGRTKFNPHLIANINEASCNQSAFGAPCFISVDIYFGTGMFVGTYEESKQSSYSSSSPTDYYNCFVRIFESIVEQLTSDKKLSRYFEYGFDNSIASSEPNIPSLPHLQVMIKEDIQNNIDAKKALLKVEEEKKRTLMYEKKRHESNSILQSLTNKLKKAIELEKWEDAKNIQILIRELEKKQSTANTPSARQPIVINPECERAKKEYNNALQKYNTAQNIRDTRNSESQFSSVGALGNRPESNLLGLFSNVTRHEANISQNDMNHALILMENAKRRISRLCNN